MEIGISLPFLSKKGTLNPRVSIHRFFTRLRFSCYRSWATLLQSPKLEPFSAAFMSDLHQIRLSSDSDSLDSSIWIYCSSSALNHVALARMGGSQFDHTDCAVRFLVANPSLLATAMFEFPFSNQTQVDEAYFQRWLLATDGVCSLSECRSVNKSARIRGKRKLWKRLQKASSASNCFKQIEKFAFKNISGKPSAVCKSGTQREISEELIGKLAKYSAEMASASDSASTDGTINLPRILKTVSALTKVQSEFEQQLFEKKMESMRLLAYGASHEINNPLANIASRAQSMLTKEDDPKRKHRLTVIFEQAMRAHEMISDMMLFAHPPKLQQEPVDLNELVAAVNEELHERLSFASISCVTKSTGPARLVVDATQVASAVKAIVVNAIEAIGTDGKIEIELGSNESELILAISDDGPGIDEAISENIFDPFFSGREAGRGLGFGLSKAWRILQLHNAKIDRFESAMGGARFELRFPKPESEPVQLQPLRRAS